MEKDNEFEMFVARMKRKSGPPEDFQFYDLRPDGGNELGSNLTELVAAKQYFDAGYTGHRDWLAHMSRFMYVARKVRRNEGTYLDVGCGRLSLPYTLNQMRRPVGEYWGLDLRAQERWAKEISWKSKTRLVRMDLILDDPATIEEWPGEFDVVTCFEVLEHVPREHAPTLVQNLYKWLKPGGLCYFSTPNANVSSSVASNHIGPDGEVREWDYDDKIAMCRDAGFTMLGEYGTFIRMDRLPDEAMEDKTVRVGREILHNEWLSILLAPPWPRESNNAVFVMGKGGES